jgi:hypothetical protein
LKLTIDKSKMVWSWENLDNGFAEEFKLDSLFATANIYIYVCMARSSSTSENSIEII